MVLLIPFLFMLCFAGLAYVILQAMMSGAEEYSSTYSEDTARQFEDVFLFIPPKRIAEIGWASAAVLFLLVFFLTGNVTTVRGGATGLALGTVVGLIALQGPRHVLVILKDRRLKRFNAQLVDTLMSMSNALKAGFSITQTFETVVKEGENPIAQEFAVFLQETRVGVNFSDALESLEKRVGSDDLMLVIRAIETARKTGGNLTEIFEKISETIRERIRIENRIQIMTAQGRLQGIVVGAMPVVIGAAMTVIDPGMMLPFLHSTIGLVTVSAVGVLVLCGALVIRKIIRIDV